MVYLRNKTSVDQFLPDPVTGTAQRVEADGLAQVTVEAAEHALREHPGRWVRVVPIVPPPPART